MKDKFLEIFKEKFFLTTIAFLVMIPLLFWARTYNYIFFHLLVETFSVIIAACVFVFAWNTRKISNNGYFLFIGIAILFVGVLDFAHTLTYKGMGVFLNIDSNIPTQIWIASRYFLSLSLLVSILYLKRKFNEKIVLFIFFLITFLLLVSIFDWKIFPTSYIEGKGLTTFKVASEYLISFIFLLTILLIRKFKDYFNRGVYFLLISSLFVSIVSDMFFTLYADVYGIFNMFGHIAKIISYYLIYKAIIEVGLTKPFDLMFLELKKGEKRKDDFLKMVTHELKSPLTSIKAYSHILTRQFDKEKDIKNRQYISQINYQADRIQNLVDDFLDMNNIRAGKFSLKTKSFNLTELTKEIVEDIKRTQKKNPLIVNSKENIVVEADKQRITQVLSNLITNAIKYSPENKKVIVKIQGKDKNVLVAVKDKGIGIPKKDQNHIFNKYYRALDKKHRADGLGLGLYISKEIVINHGGKIWVSSEKGKGSTFYFSLPLKQAHDQLFLEFKESKSKKRK